MRGLTFVALVLPTSNKVSFLIPHGNKLGVFRIRQTRPQFPAAVAPFAFGRAKMSSTRDDSLESPLVTNGKKVPQASTSSFLITAAFIPLWAVTVLPLSLVYQVALRPVTRALRGSLTRSPPASTAALDSGYIVDPATIIPRSERKYDIVVMGATGFTGSLAVRHLAKTYGVGQSVKWAIAGRSEVKLNKVKSDLARELDMPEILSVDTILVDSSVAATLPKLVSQTRVVATTAGPYTLYGCSVVEFCAKFGTHYVDITGEVPWVKAMICQWQETAQASGAILIPFCGHDSIPWDLSALELQTKLAEDQGAQMKSLFFWDELRGAAPGGTFATIINAIDGHSIQPPRVAFDPFLRLPDGSQSSHVCKAVLPALPAPSTSPWESSRDNTAPKQWTAPFVMAVVNEQVVRWSYALRSQGQNSITYSEAALHPDFKTAFVNFAGFIMFGSMLLNPITSFMLQKYMIPKPGEGPPMKAMEEKHFLCVKGEAIGDNGSRAESIFYLDKDAGCLETSRMMIEAGLCLALEETTLPVQKGGFVSPAAGLGRVLMKRLLQTGTYFESKAYPALKVQSKL